MIARIGAYRNILIKNINLREATNQHAASNHVTPMWQSNTSDSPQGVFKVSSLKNLLKLLTKRSLISWQIYMEPIYWKVMPKGKKGKQRHRLYKVRKSDERATNQKEVNKTCVEKLSISNKTDVHNTCNNNRDGTPCMSNGGELSSRNCAAVDSPNVPTEAQALVDKYLQSEKDLADRAKKNIQIVIVYRRQLVISEMKGLWSARKWGNNTTQNGKGTPDHVQNSGNMNNNATVKMQLVRKNPAYMDDERECNKVGRSVIGWRSG